MVTKTSYITLKGSLVRDILYPKESKYDFARDTYYYIGVMALIGLVGFCFTVPTLIDAVNDPVDPDDVSDVVDKCLDLMTVVVPPALPATMTVGTVFAVGRLKKSKIFCISPPKVNICGMVRMFVFDKTGTLTEDGL